MHLKRLLFAQNDPRSEPLFQAFRSAGIEAKKIDFDAFSPIYKYSTAMLTWHPHRKSWWIKYQWHSLIQHARRQLVRAALENERCDAIFMWGSWFKPLAKNENSVIPCFHYIDQSCAPDRDAGDADLPGIDAARKRFCASQGETYLEAAHVFCMSDWALQQTVDAHPHVGDKVSAIGWGPIGVDLSSERRNWDQKHEQRVLFVGHEFLRKGVDYLRAAADLVWKHYPDAHFRVVGGNSDSAKISWGSKFEIVGRITDQEELKDEFRRASLFVLPHRFDRSPHAIVEAMSASLPIVTSKQGGAMQAVADGENGFLVEVGDVEALAARIGLLLGAPELRMTMGSASKKRMLRDFTWSGVAARAIGQMEASLGVPATAPHPIET